MHHLAEKCGFQHSQNLYIRASDTTEDEKTVICFIAGVRSYSHGSTQSGGYC